MQPVHVGRHRSIACRRARRGTPTRPARGLGRLSRRPAVGSRLLVNVRRRGWDSSRCRKKAREKKKYIAASLVGLIDVPPVTISSWACIYGNGLGPENPAMDCFARTSRSLVDLLTSAHVPNTDWFYASFFKPFLFFLVETAARKCTSSCTKVHLKNAINRKRPCRVRTCSKSNQSPLHPVVTINNP